MTIVELAQEQGTVTKEFHSGAVVFKANGFEMYIERTSFGYILQVYVNKGITHLFQTIDELKDAIENVKRGIL
jgi:hypothetical protein